MTSRLNEIENYLLRCGVDKEELESRKQDAINLAFSIAEYAHRDQKRENGDPYICHPASLVGHYERLIDFNPNKFSDDDKDKLDELGIPFIGVEEVCFLHDVLEDTDFTIDEIEEIFASCGFKDYFIRYIKTPLLYITHDKTMSYDKYVSICMQHPVSAMVKMLDLQDNSNLLTLKTLGEKELKRARDYQIFIYLINNFFKFIENANEYRKSLLFNTIYN